MVKKLPKKLSIILKTENIHNTEKAEESKEELNQN